MKRKKIKSEFEIISEKLDIIILLIQNTIAIDLFVHGIKQSDIGKRLHVRNETINKLLKGIKKPKL